MSVHRHRSNDPCERKKIIWAITNDLSQPRCAKRCLFAEVCRMFNHEPALSCEEDRNNGDKAFCLTCHRRFFPKNSCRSIQSLTHMWAGWQFFNENFRCHHNYRKKVGWCRHINDFAIGDNFEHRSIHCRRHRRFNERRLTVAVTFFAIWAVQQLPLPKDIILYHLVPIIREL